MSDIEQAPAPPTVTLTFLPTGQVNITTNCPVGVALNMVQLTLVELLSIKIREDLKGEASRIAVVNHLPPRLRGPGAPL